MGGWVSGSLMKPHPLTFRSTDVLHPCCERSKGVVSGFEEGGGGGGGGGVTCNFHVINSQHRLQLTTGFQISHCVCETFKC